MKKSSNLTNAISASLVIVALSVAYYLVIYIPTQNKLKIQAETQKVEALKTLQVEKKNDYDSCLEIAFSTYEKSWEGSCKSRGLKENCSLPSSQAKTYDDAYENEKDRCLKIYQTN